MTLFHLREFWSFNCGNEEEEFDKTSLCICNIDNCPTGYDKIITASFNGILRVFKIEIDNIQKNEQSHFQPSNLLLEVDLKSPILQVAGGILLSSSNIQLAILHPNKLSVYSLSSSSGMTEHGTSYNILLIYEHNFDYKAVNMLLGPFGQIKGKDIVCTQSINSALNFYENESFAFSFDWNKDSIKRFPMEFTYIPNRDLIVLVNNIYFIECYRYQDLAMADLNLKNDEMLSKEKRKQPNPEWTYSFGESVLDMQTVLLDKWYIVVLGERNLCVLRDNGSLWFVKKFDINPSCLCAFGNEIRDSLITIVGSHMFNMLIYQNDILKWATKIPFVPVCISRINLNDISGAIVLMSDKGHLTVGYLGTNPSLKIISMPANTDTSNMEKINQELKDFKKFVNLEGNKYSEEDKYAKYISIFMHNIEPEDNNNLGDNSRHFSVIIEIVTQIIFQDVKLLFYNNDFFNISPEKQIIAVWEKSFKFKAQISLNADLPLTTKIKCCIILHKENVCRSITKWARIPFPSLIRKQMSPKSNKFCVKVSFPKTFEDKASINNLFEDILSDNASLRTISLNYISHSQIQATIRLNVDDVICYQIDSNHISGLCFTLNELTKRLKSMSISEKAASISVNFQLIDSLCSSINQRIKQRNKIFAYKQELNKLAQHFRVLQKRILIKLKDKNPTSLDNLEKLLYIIQSKISAVIDKISNGLVSLNNRNYTVWANLSFIKTLFKILIIEDQKAKKFLKLITINQMSDFIEQWEEQFESSLLETFELSKDIGSFAKIIDYENHKMQNCQTLRDTLNTVFQYLDSKSTSSIQMVSHIV